MNIRGMFECCFPQDSEKIAIINRVEKFSLKDDENAVTGSRKMYTDSANNTGSDKGETGTGVKSNRPDEDKKLPPPLLIQNSYTNHSNYSREDSPQFKNIQSNLNQHQQSYSNTNLQEVHNNNSNNPSSPYNMINLKKNSSGKNLISIGNSGRIGMTSDSVCNHTGTFGNIMKKGYNDNNSVLSFNMHQSVHSLNNHSMDSCSHDNHKSNHKTYEDSSLDFVNINRMITENEIKSAPELLIEEIEGDILKNNKLVINAAGMVNGARKAKDGIVYFGTKYKNNEGTILNDYVLNIDMPGLSAIVFIIYYKKETSKYYLRCYRDKNNPGLSLILIKLDNVYILKKKEILAVGDLYFQLQAFQDRIEIVKLASKASPDTNNYVFQNEFGSITIGRDKKCTIVFEGNKSFSRINCTIEYDKELSYWKLMDGGKGKSSTNGTWIFAAHSYEIQEGTVFKIGNSKLRAIFSSG